MVLARFLPKDEQFFSHFKDAADNAAETARVLTEVVDGGADTERRVRRLRDLEHQGDEISHRIFNALNSTFVTPLDREDIRGLTTSIDDFVDGLEEAGKRVWLYRLGADRHRQIARQNPARTGHDHRPGNAMLTTLAPTSPRFATRPKSSTGSKTKPTTR